MMRLNCWNYLLLFQEKKNNNWNLTLRNEELNRNDDNVAGRQTLLRSLILNGPKIKDNGWKKMIMKRKIVSNKWGKLLVHLLPPRPTIKLAVIYILTLLWKLCCCHISDQSAAVAVSIAAILLGACRFVKDFHEGCILTHVSSDIAPWSSLRNKSFGMVHKHQASPVISLT